MPDDYLEFSGRLNLAAAAWKAAGINYAEVEAMSDYEREMLRVWLGI